MLREIPPGPPPLSEWDKLIIGPAKRITIPLEDKFVLQKVADLLHGLATVIAFESRLPKKSERESLIRIRCEIDQTNEKIRYAARQAGIYWHEGGQSAALKDRLKDRGL